jgi:hypothetical protein
LRAIKETDFICAHAQGLARFALCLALRQAAQRTKTAARACSLDRAFFGPLAKPPRRPHARKNASCFRENLIFISALYNPACELARN